MQTSRLEVVCLQVGDGFPDEYVVRLESMLRRHVGRPFRLTCLTDRHRRLPKSILQRDVSGWEICRPDMRPTQRKLYLFDQASTPYPEFLYLDISLVVKSSLGPLLNWVDARPEPLAIVDNWNHDTVNSCVMRIRPSAALQSVFDDYRSGKRYEVRLKGDQDYLHAAVAHHGLGDHVVLIPESLVAMYRRLRRLNRTDPTLARQKLDEACILKFHGLPRPHDLLSLRGKIREASHSPGHLRSDWGYLSRDVANWWRVSDPHTSGRSLLARGARRLRRLLEPEGTLGDALLPGEGS